jgi:predicted lipoprotein with Yx(FWY)xxD motif
MGSRTLIATVMLLAFSGSSYAAEPILVPGVSVKQIASPGGPLSVLADAKGMTLYTYDNDTVPAKSVCSGPCAEFWPPLLVTSDARMLNWTIVDREDGTKQWAYKGKPLYIFVKDKTAADANGKDMPKNKPVWHCAVPG